LAERHEIRERHNDLAKRKSKWKSIFSMKEIGTMISRMVMGFKFGWNREGKASF
jgi:hypothetical protein